MIGTQPYGRAGAPVRSGITTVVDRVVAVPCGGFLVAAFWTPARAGGMDCCEAIGYAARMTPKPADVARYHTYAYTFIDDLSFIAPHREVVDTEWGPEAEDWPAFEAALHRRFEAMGWEGDGQLGMIWLPPFVGAGVEDSWGVAVWHVKQSNNGISFLACEHPLPFAPLAE